MIQQPIITQCKEGPTTTYERTTFSMNIIEVVSDAPSVAGSGIVMMAGPPKCIHRVFWQAPPGKQLTGVGGGGQIPAILNQHGSSHTRLRISILHSTKYWASSCVIMDQRLGTNCTQCLSTQLLRGQPLSCFEQGSCRGPSRIKSLQPVSNVYSKTHLKCPVLNGFT